MRLHYLIPLFAICFAIAFAATSTTPNRDNFLARAAKYITIWNTKQLGTFCDPIMSDVIALKTMSQISDNCMTYAIAIYASNMLAALPLLTLKSNMDSCLKPYNSDTMSLLSPIMGGVGLGMTKAYKLMKKKVMNMTSNGKTKAVMQENLYYLGAAACTPDLIQHLLWLAMKNVTAGQWSCCVKYMPSLLSVSAPQFDLTYRPNKWIYPYKK